MACWCEQTEQMKRLEWVRDMAKKSAVLTGSMQVIYRDGDGFGFAPYDGFDGEIMEIISNI